MVMFKEMLWSLFILVVPTAHAAHSHKGSQGLSCVNDFVNNVSCSWSGTPAAPNEDCWIFGVLTSWQSVNSNRKPIEITRGCKLKLSGSSPPGCSFVFENEEFAYFAKISFNVKCNGTLVEKLTDYELHRHVKMNPPGVPNVNRTANETWISWNPGRPRSDYIDAFDFQVQLKQETQMWKDARNLSTQQQHLKIPDCQEKVHCQVRVRVKTSKTNYNSTWSNWSPTTTWVGAATSQDEGWPLQHISLLVQGVMLSIGLLVVLLILLGLSFQTKRHLKVKPVPNPSRYFPTLQSVHGGNLKKWLNPLSASELFFTAQTRDPISKVEVYESWDVPASAAPSSSSTRALLHGSSYSTADSDTSGVFDNSSSSSCFSNMGYFMSNASSSLARTGPIPAYFTYKDDCHNFQLSLCPSFTAALTYESLKREPQSPDSGFSIGQEDEEDSKDENNMALEEILNDHQSSPLLILPLHLPSRACPPSSASPPPHPPSPSFGNQELDDEPEAPACGSFAAWPVAGFMSRSSSLPVEPCKTGYLTLNELQTTFSNKSI
ncbi:interleukin-2 receptor subunit beta isoform X1 [Echeneis naucrates]|uniref:Interleukin-2 receptor subunit beta-like n=1 Tax=Echeneis naucrates TaxID=173247 RepID=A0A665SUJ8_ECHNA|nr:interleukin-2 receptor subunit beta-like isoform X1 [Echeneis naucrates]XP_029364147.1 interleukin-2 receptor subunit beta-like isoform X1 [Echeneis naucrates]